MRYFYKFAGGNAIASAASDNPKYIYPDCSGDADCEECGYQSGDALRMALGGGKPEVCRNIAKYCPDGASCTTPPPTCDSLTQCCRHDGTVDPTKSMMSGQCCLTSKQIDHDNCSGTWTGCACTTPPPTCDSLTQCCRHDGTVDPTKIKLGSECCPPSLKDEFDWCTAVSSTWKNCECCFGACCQADGTMTPGSSDMGGQCCPDSKMTNYLQCLPPNQWTGCDCVASPCTCTSSTNDPDGLSIWYPELSSYWTCKDIVQTSRQYMECTPPSDSCYSHYKPATLRNRCGTKVVTCANRCTQWAVAWDSNCVEDPDNLGTWQESGTKTRSCNNPCSSGEGSCLSVTPTYCATSATDYRPCSPTDECSSGGKVDDEKRSCEGNGRHFSATLVPGETTKYDCKCEDTCDTLDGTLYASMSVSYAQTYCDGKRGTLGRSLVTAGHYNCFCNLNCTSKTDTTGNTTTPTTPILASQIEDECSREVGGTSFNHDSFSHTSGTISNKCAASDAVGPVPYRFTRDGQGACTCIAPIKKNAHCIGNKLTAMIRIFGHDDGDAEFVAATKDELAACYTPCQGKATLDDSKQCYADKLNDAVNAHGLPDVGMACEAMAFYNSVQLSGGDCDHRRRRIQLRGGRGNTGRHEEQYESDGGRSELRFSAIYLDSSSIIGFTLRRTRCAC